LLQKPNHRFAFTAGDGVIGFDAGGQKIVGWLLLRKI